jgi:hypothetical protein
VAEQSVTLRRSELHDRVWKQPVRAVAAEIGISDVAVAKACRKNGIPLPGRGYWRRKACGYNTPPVPLPKLMTGGDPWITFTVIPRQMAPAANPEKEEEKGQDDAILVPTDLGRRHGVVRATLAALRRQRRSPRPLLMTRYENRFAASVSVQSLDRVERILQALVTAFVARGFEIRPGELGRPLAVVVNADPIELVISERTKRVVHVLTEKEEVRQELNPGWQPPLYDVIPTGSLAIRVMNHPGPSQAATVRDRTSAPLESRLGTVLSLMKDAARRLRENREAEERRRKAWEEDSRRREEERRSAELERARFRRMDALVDRWRKHEELRSFLDVVRERMKVARPKLVPMAQGWVDWAEAYLEKDHPEDALFFEPLLEHGSSAFWQYADSHSNQWR